jgi:hypothetical protein
VQDIKDKSRRLEGTRQAIEIFYMARHLKEPMLIEKSWENLVEQAKHEWGNECEVSVISEGVMVKLFDHQVIVPWPR